MAEEQKEAMLPLEDANAPIIYFDGVQGVSIVEGAIHLNLVQSLFGLPGGDIEGLRRKTAARLVMTPQTFIRLADLMKELREKFVGDGLIMVTEGALANVAVREGL
jgi:hypothetical protein